MKNLSALSALSVSLFYCGLAPAVAQVTTADYQRAQSLRRQNKNFDLLIYPGEDHNAGRGGQCADYGERKRFDFFVRQLLNHAPPECSAPPASTSSQQQ